jgi:hypothetical protein
MPMSDYVRGLRTQIGSSLLCSSGAAGMQMKPKPQNRQQGLCRPAFRLVLTQIS